MATVEARRQLRPGLVWVPSFVPESKAARDESSDRDQGEARKGDPRLRLSHRTRKQCGRDDEGNAAGKFRIIGAAGSAPHQGQYPPAVGRGEGFSQEPARRIPCTRRGCSTCREGARPAPCRGGSSSSMATVRDEAPARVAHRFTTGRCQARRSGRSVGARWGTPTTLGRPHPAQPAQHAHDRGTPAAPRPMRFRSR
jgi:hypothetical protein